MLIENRKARFNYELQEKLSAGIELLGLEVKSVRQKQGSLDGSYVIVRGKEAFLINAFIPPYQPANTGKEYDARRNRRLLLTKREVEQIAGTEHKHGLTIVPLAMYNKGRKIKLEIAIARGKKKYDKRETMKRKDAMREVERTLKYDRS